MKSEVFVYHDETQCAGEEKLWGHILFFVPNKVKSSYVQYDLLENEKVFSSWKLLSEKITYLRDEYNYNSKFHFKNISGKKWTKYNQAEKLFTIFCVDALKVKKPKYFECPLFCKMGVIFFPSPSKNNLKFYQGKTRNENSFRFYETLLRMLIKGVVHYLYDETHKVKILKIISDGKPFHRKLSKKRILKRLTDKQLENGLRRYVDLSKTEIVHLSSDHKEFDVASIEYYHANMLQLADLLLGCTIKSCLKGIKNQEMNPKIGDQVLDKKSIIAYPVSKMLDKRKRGNNFKYSSHFKSFSISKASIIDDKWEFDNLQPMEIDIRLSNQLTLDQFFQ